jgi:predicted amino acid-binding ACT domain protein
MESNVVAGVAYSRDEAKMTLISVADRPGIAAAIFGPLAEAGVNVDMIVQNISEEGRTDMTFSCPVDQVTRAEKAMQEPRTRGEINFHDLSPTRRRQGLGRRHRHAQPVGVAAKMFEALRRRGHQHQGHHHLRDQDLRADRPQVHGTGRAGAARRVRAGKGGLRDEPLNPPPVVGTDSVPEWWISTLKLVTLADMAVNRLLRDPVSTEGHNAQIWETVIRDIYRRRAAMGKRPPASLTLMADTSVVCVMPKVRVAAVGATLRNMTRNLALLPGHREVRCRWDFSPDVAPSEDLDTLDILLIPAPFELQGNNFVANRDANATLSELRYYKKGWETFRIEQTWIKGEKRASFIEDCLKLMERARQETACVNGVILPEYALDYDLFHELCTALKGIEKNLEFVISGSSSNCRTDDGEYRANENDEVPNLGNHVVSRVWYDRGREEVYIDNSRIKHHRWRLDRPQVETYALSTALNPKIENWWEDTPLGRREIHFHRFREKSVFSVLICEELARSEPCHEILRSVAPNLIFALLLDGPQIKERWPAQYASNLADDPGSSVLTFTSWGLIARSNAQGRYKENRSIALWKDDGGNFLSIQMPTGNGARGVLLSLWSAHVKDMTMAGKQSVARAWRYSSHMPITLSQ